MNPLPTKASFSASGLTRGIYYWWPKKLLSCPWRLVIHLCFLRMTHTPRVLSIPVNLSGIMKDSGISPYNLFFPPKGLPLRENCHILQPRGASSEAERLNLCHVVPSTHCPDASACGKGAKRTCRHEYRLHPSSPRPQQPQREGKCLRQDRLDYAGVTESAKNLRGLAIKI